MKLTSDNLSFSSYSKVNVLFKLLTLGFSLQETLALLTILIKTIQCEMENDIGNYYY